MRDCGAVLKFNFDFMKISIIDAHTHAQFPEFDSDRKEVIARALSLGIGMVNVGADLASSQKAVALAKEYKNGVWAAVGIHPADAQMNVDMKLIGKLAMDEKVVSIGECGLDYFRAEQSADGKERMETQKRIFVEQIELARDAKKPLMVHCRDAFPDMIDILTANRHLLILENPGIIHFFTGEKEHAEKLLALGFSFTFGGLVTFNRSFDEVISFIPEEKILVETDAPFVAPLPFRGKRNEPSYVSEIVPFIASLKGKDVGKMKKILLKNTERVLKINV